MRNPNVRILVIVFVLMAIAAAVGVFGFRNSFSPAEPVSPDLPQGYLRIQVGDQVLDPVPLADGGEYTLDQHNGRVNVIHTTATGAVMHSSTCDNQSCVQQGEVTLENRGSRVLMNMIICLPNEVVLEVLTPEEAGMEAAQ